MSSVHKNFDELCSLDNVFNAWKIFRRGKTRKKDVMNFEVHVEDNLFKLHEQLQDGTYTHSPYSHFVVFDNKKRDIYKAEIKDRIVHQIVYEYLLSLFEPIFITDSYASRICKGQYKAICALRYFIKLTRGRNNTSYVLKCDVKKYFDTIDQNILLEIIEQKIIHTGKDENSIKIRNIIKEIVFSYTSTIGTNKGIPLGNVTSQIFANIYLNVLDQYIKKELGCRYYVRYNDDFVIVSKNKQELEKIREKIVMFVKKKLSLDIPIEKTSIRKVKWGIDFLGFTILPNVMLLRDKTKQKLYEHINRKNIHSYMSILKQCDSYTLRNKILALERLAEDW
jgi:RNA-directed DNA polymerase